MAKILYGVAGQGSGHSIRSHEVISYLKSRGHDVKIVSHDTGYKNLSKDFEVDESIEIEEEAVDLEDDDLEEINGGEIATITLGEIYLSRGKPDKALEIFEILKEKDPNNLKIQEKIKIIKW